MAHQLIPLFKANYIDYSGSLRYLEVKCVYGQKGLLFFHCIIDEEQSYNIRLSEDGQWCEYQDGPTVLADEIGSIIELKVF
ncbi:hypothetical protein ACX0G9_01885 [Flavitalea flava]